jgi:glutathione synthase/RimK-type ligase-like ATP-grasp enzyme
MILVCGGLADSVTELVCARLQDCGYPFRLLDLGSYPTGFQIRWHWRGSVPEGSIAGPDWTVDLDELTGVYARFLGADGRLPPPNIAPVSAPAVHHEADTALMAMLEDLPCPVVNRLGGGMSNNSKAYQALLLRECGLMVPPTLVTNDPTAAMQFYEDHGREVIYKSLSGIRSIVRRVGTEQLSRFDLLRNGPAQFQSFIPGENVRVHTVGDRLFATRVHTEACLRVARELDLLLTGIDLKETPEGDYYCFEVNPCPGFIFYERQTGQPISTALADLLHQDTTTRHNVERRTAMR